MNTDRMKAVLVIVTGVFIAVALMGTPTVLFWATVWAKRNNYLVAAFQVQDTSLSNPQRRFKQFWILNGIVEGRGERLVVPLNASGHQPPFAAGNLLQVRYNPDGATVVLAGRSLRVITLDEYSAAGRNLAVSVAGFYGPVIAVALMWLVRRVWRVSPSSFVRRRLRIWSSVLLLSGLGLAVWGYWNRGTRPRSNLNRLSIESLGQPLVRVLSLAQVDNGEPFAARVEYKKPESDSLTVYLRRADGTELAIRENTTNTSHVILLESLTIGEKYHFPLTQKATAPTK